MGYVYSLIHQLMENIPYHFISKEEFNTIFLRMERINRFIQYVSENYSGRVRLSTLAEKEGLSISYLSHFIKEHLNYTFQEYVDLVRFNCARRLLRTSDKRILDICIESGFSDPRYMNRAFLKHTGMLPEAFRKHYGVNQNIATLSSIHSFQQFFGLNESLEILQDYFATQ